MLNIPTMDRTVSAADINACLLSRVVQQQGVQLVTDSVSYELLKGATVDYTTDLIRASFEVGRKGIFPCLQKWSRCAHLTQCICCRSQKIPMHLGHVVVGHLLSQRCDTCIIRFALWYCVFSQKQSLSVHCCCVANSLQRVTCLLLSAWRKGQQPDYLLCYSTPCTLYGILCPDKHYTGMFRDVKPLLCLPKIIAR